MTQIEYLSQLEKNLTNKISKDEVYDIMRDFAEYFEEGKKQGKTEYELTLQFGDPKDVANQIIAESKVRIAQEKPTIPNLVKAHVAVKGFNILSFLIALPFVLFAIFILGVVLFSVGFALLCGLGLILFTCGFFSFAPPPLSISAIFGGIFVVGASLVIIGLLVKGIHMILLWIARRLKKITQQGLKKYGYGVENDEE